MQENPNEELVDKISERVISLLGRNQPVKRLRKSQILSALLGAIGFALFVDGVVKISHNLPSWVSLAIGFALMAVTGLLLHNLNR